eukprot:9615746-Karenia_brevis.AAC.1
MVDFEHLFLGAADMENAFYNLAIPKDLAEHFSLPTIRAGHIGLESKEGVALSPDDVLLPVLQVLPMGWSWS